MGLTRLNIAISNPSDKERAETVEMLIDSGAIFSIVPASLLERLGIEPDSAETFRLADGSTIVRKRGTANFRYGNRIGGAAVIFGEPTDSLLLGAHTLESLGLSLDPTRGELVDIPFVV